MTFEYLLAVLTFTFVSSITPGPNNMMLLASGVNYGMRRSMPHVLGIGIGFALMVFLVGLGLAQIFDRMPVLHSVVKWGGVIYMLYLAWKIANSAAPANNPNVRNASKPFTFLQAAGFQWLNAKAWAMALAAIAAYVPQIDHQTSLPHLVVVCLSFWAVNLVTSFTWSGFGVQLRGWLSDTDHLRLFNWGMAFALVASIAPMI